MSCAWTGALLLLGAVGSALWSKFSSVHHRLTTPQRLPNPECNSPLPRPLAPPPRLLGNRPGPPIHDHFLRRGRAHPRRLHGRLADRHRRLVPHGARLPAQPPARHRHVLGVGGRVRGRGAAGPGRHDGVLRVGVPARARSRGRREDNNDEYRSRPRAAAAGTLELRERIHGRQRGLIPAAAEHVAQDPADAADAVARHRADARHGGRVAVLYCCLRGAGHTVRRGGRQGEPARRQDVERVSGPDGGQPAGLFGVCREVGYIQGSGARVAAIGLGECCCTTFHVSCFFLNSFISCHLQPR